ncbi:MAG: hypothetical protein MK214_16225 [Thalassotalea sp.]|nr:hypothetical protein [Thalassotalea sp.]
METFIGSILIGLLLLSLIYSSIKTSKAKTRIKEQSIRNSSSERNLEKEELEDQFTELALMYEDLEQTYWVHIATLVGIISFFWLNIWYLSLGVSLLVIFLGDRYLSLKPFKLSTPLE